jgi:hypothetical protein
MLQLAPWKKRPRARDLAGGAGGHDLAGWVALIAGCLPTIGLQPGWCQAMLTAKRGLSGDPPKLRWQLAPEGL